MRRAGIVLDYARDLAADVVSAASTALVLGPERRRDGRWIRNTHIGSSSSMDAAMTKATTQCGLILDTLGRDSLREAPNTDVRCTLRVFLFRFFGGGIRLTGAEGQGGGQKKPGVWLQRKIK